MSDKCSVHVALRIRPLVQSELARGSKNAIEVYETLNQVKVAEKPFTFNYIFDSHRNQEDFYKETVQPLVENLYKGYNLTILAYGQTGSGKTYTMGTSYKGDGEMGVIPRSVNEIFNHIKDNFSYDFNVTVSFVELYQEVLYDLLSGKSREQSMVEIREDSSKGVHIPNLREESVSSAYETLKWLEKGSKGRATASTNMNTESSRSHAIVTIRLAMQQKGTALCRSAKFHLVDLAGSERSSKTGATGQVFKEGVNINKALLALGNVISALGDEKGPQTYINYRDSPLTRLLKDSLGGNSITLMIACVSPADYNTEETISTLRYADRAKRIKNKPMVNEDAKTSEIIQLKKLVQTLKLELVGQGGSTISNSKYEHLKKDLDRSKTTMIDLKNKLHSTLTQNSALFERILMAQTAIEGFSSKLNEIKSAYDLALSKLSDSLSRSDLESIKEQTGHLADIQSKINSLREENQKNEEELRSQEKNTFGVATSSCDTSLSETEIHERQESHTAEQIAMNAELQEVAKMLMHKEALVKQMAANSEFNMVDASEVAANEAKIAALETEKLQLLQRLKTSQAQGTSKKVAELHKKRIDELEHQIQDLNRKLRDQSRLLKLKEKNDLKVQQLNADIVAMKSAKVKLIRNMKQESDRFRTWKLQRERELSKLRDQDRKKQNQINNMERIHSRQQNVLKRKVEEAAALNKRLKESLALRKQAQSSKVAGKAERLGPWVKNEFDVYIAIVEARSTLECLIHDRELLQNELDNLTEADTCEIQKIQDQLEIQTGQIVQLQQKIIDNDEEAKIVNRFDNVQTMSEAKFVVGTLFDLAANSKRHEIESNHRLQDKESSNDELKKKFAEMQREMELLKRTHKEEMADMESEHEELKSLLLRNARGQTEAFSEKESGKVDKMKDTIIKKLEIQLQMKNEENDRLRQETDDLKQALEDVMKLKEEENSPLRTSDDKENTPINTTFNVRDAKRESPKHRLNESLGTPIIIEDDPIKDPDWTKTPLGIKVRHFRAQRVLKDETSKRNSKGGCSCKLGACDRRNCGCRKYNLSCSVLCKCNPSTCKNTAKLEMPSSTTTIDDECKDDQNGDGENGSFKKPRLFQLC